MLFMIEFVIYQKKKMIEFVAFWDILPNIIQKALLKTWVVDKISEDDQSWVVCNVRVSKGIWWRSLNVTRKLLGL